MTAFLKGLRFEAREKGVRVLDVFLGATQTPMQANRSGYGKVINASEAATAIYNTAIITGNSLQIDELHIGRFKP